MVLKPVIKINASEFFAKLGNLRIESKCKLRSQDEENETYLHEYIMDSVRYQKNEKQNIL
jgi:hypothetical protein